ncbi:interleukin 12 receptor, beta 2a, like [Acanthochromis polyacanthus]|uniref:interleukin 12 receptor, beta 2a, like n=1 Tax=Acanthochromis polyacanthus TaxID=80966 RepID=UPI002234DD3D|nr:interleukin 12 receptor, beta 2a, like [Acanthochromis polyacanthus]
MATPKIWWLLSILLATSSNCSATGPPARPSRPQCYRQCDEIGCAVNIQCMWDPKPDPKIPTNYILHWEPANSEDGHTTKGNSSSGVIPRDHSNFGELRVWVQAQNQHGSANSDQYDFHTEDIIKPQPPKFSSSDQEQLEIHWNTFCGQLSIGPCDVRYRTEEDRVWFENETGFHPSYSLPDAQPNTVYEFQVRCACHTGLKSDWSAILRIINAESVPVGEVDVWSDCGISPTSLDCFLTWKNLSISQARRPILGYRVRILYNDGTESVKNVSTAEPSSQFMCDDSKWCLDFPLKDVSSVAVSAYNALGATVPSSLVVPKTAGKKPNDQPIHLNMNQENLTVSWDQPSPFPDNLKEYVVQYKQAGCSPGRGFDWIKVNKSQTAAFFKGQFRNYTAYQVSLFSVSNSLQVRLLASVIEYSTQSTPSAVPVFDVTSIGTTDVTLSWEPVPLSKQTGLILFYQIGLDGRKVYNISASPQHEGMTFKLQDLRPGQDYEVWIKAVTMAGPGKSATKSFKTKKSENGQLTAIMLGVLLVVFSIVLAVFLLCVCRRENKVCPLMSQCLYDKVPDPGNSHIFSHLKHQFNEPMGWICIPTEPQPKISLLEIVEKTPQASDGLTKLVVRDGGSHMNDDEKEDAVRDESDRTDHRYGKQAYSKMVDSDEEKDGCWSSLEEQDIPSGYERHFMPSAAEILEL